MVVLQVHVNYEFMIEVIEVGPLMSKNQVKKSQFCVTSPLLPWLRGRGVTIVVFPSLTFISLCKQVDLGRPLTMRFIDSKGTIVGPS